LSILLILMTDKLLLGYSPF